MIDFQFRTEHAKGSDPPYAEAYGEWAVSKPVTREEYERFCDGMDWVNESFDDNWFAEVEEEES